MRKQSKFPKLTVVGEAKPAVPTGLSPEAQSWFTRLAEEYRIDDAGGIAVLTAAAEAYDRTLQAKAMIAAEGLTSTDRWGQLKPHPAIIIEKTARTQMLSALRQLHLDVEPLQPRPGRPAGSRNF